MGSGAKRGGMGGAHGPTGLRFGMGCDSIPTRLFSARERMPGSGFLQGHRSAYMRRILRENAPSCHRVAWLSSRNLCSRRNAQAYPGILSHTEEGCETQSRDEFRKLSHTEASPLRVAQIIILRWLRFTHPTHFRSTPSGSEYRVCSTSGFADAHPEGHGCAI